MACVAASVAIHELAVLAVSLANHARPGVAINIIVVDDHGRIDFCHLLLILDGVG